MIETLRKYFIGSLILRERNLGKHNEIRVYKVSKEGIKIFAIIETYESLKDITTKLFRNYKGLENVDLSGLGQEQ